MWARCWSRFCCSRNPNSPHTLQVSDLAQILNVSVGQVQVALSLAVRLGFATRLREDGLTGKACGLGFRVWAEFRGLAQAVWQACRCSREGHVA